MKGQSLVDKKQADDDKKEEKGEKVVKPAEVKKTGLVGPETPQLLEKAQPEILKYYLNKRLPKEKVEAKDTENATAGADSKDEKTESKEGKKDEKVGAKSEKDVADKKEADKAAVEEKVEAAAEEKVEE